MLRRQPSPEILVIGTLGVLFLVAHVSDQWIFHHFTFSGIYDPGWARMLRLAGYFPLWGIVALALALHDWVPRTLSTLREASRRGLLLFWSAALGGIVAEALKLAFRRERPGLTDGLRTEIVDGELTPEMGVVTGEQVQKQSKDGTVNPFAPPPVFKNKK